MISYPAFLPQIRLQNLNQAYILLLHLLRHKLGLQGLQYNKQKAQKQFLKNRQAQHIKSTATSATSILWKAKKLKSP